MPQIKIFDPSHIAAMLEHKCGGQPADDYFNIDDAESKRDRYLGKMALDERV